MKNKTGFTNNSLRNRAEQALSSGQIKRKDEFADIKNYVHELQVHQIELEMQADELRRTQTELEISRDEYSTLYDHSPVGYLTINSTGVIVKLNLTAADMIGVKRERLLHKPLSRFIDTKDHTLFFAVCKNAATSDQFRTCELRFLKEDGNEFHGRLDIKPIDGIATPSYRVSLVDITQRKKAEEAKLRLEKEILKTQKEDSLRRLAGGIAHNFNNLLTIALGNIELIKDCGYGAEDIMERLDPVQESLLRAADLSKMMLCYLGQAPSNMNSVDLVDTLDTLVPIIRRTIHGAIDFDFNSDAGPIHIKGNPAQIAQILNNLVANAVEAIGAGAGKVAVRLYQKKINSRTSFNDDNLKHLKPGEYACIEVRDTGCGMDKSTVEKAVDPFFTTNFTGRGLGLSAVSGIVQYHSGYLNINSELGHGTTAVVLLPILWSPPPISESDLPQFVPNQVITGKTILYIDDDTIVRTLGKMMLAKRGAKVLEANGGREGVEVFKKNKDSINCIILDFAMPDQDGNLTLIELRQLQPAIPVLLVSGYLQHQMKNVFHIEKPNAFLQKPFSYESFISALERLLYYHEFPPEINSDG